MKLLSAALKRIIRQGHLTVLDATDRLHEFGEPDAPHVMIKLHDKQVARAIALNPQLALGEAYMDGRLTVEGGHHIEDLLELLTSNLGTSFGGGHFEWLAKLQTWKRHLAQFNPRSRAQANVAHHYDLSGALYDFFLDSDKQYSCGYFKSPHDDLETAQQRKKQLIAAKLNLKPEQTVLDIGSGWGGLALYLAKVANASVTGVTLSKEQLAIASDRAANAGLGSKVDFRLEDYRNVSGQFDRIVSVGMFEHVGIGYYDEFFKKISSLLKDDGVALIHSIGRSDGPGATNPWIDKYIFPGGYTPALSEVLGAVERNGLFVTDIEVLRLHYAYTLAEWRRRFRSNWMTAVRFYGERFCRMWEFYLAGAEMGFRYQGLMVFQLQLAKRVDALPITRDYMMPQILAHRKVERAPAGKRKTATAA
jgi:cyclopropane-fatty-acyl-phospholipid synthase